MLGLPNPHKRGLGGDRLALLYGGMDDDDRDRIVREFQAPPSLRPMGILLATDTASEGIDLQRHCRLMVPVEIPFNPNRLEQRKGRIDRHGQPAKEVRIYHFVGTQLGVQAGSLDADLEFLSRAARKVERIREFPTAASHMIKATMMIIRDSTTGIATHTGRAIPT